MQCVTWNKSSLFALRLKTLENKEKTNILVEQAKFPNLLEMKTQIHSGMKLRCE
jgi:hypothetical protein